MSEDELAKDLGLLSALMIGIGTMIGAGIFVLPGIAAQTTGPIVVASFVIGGLIAMVNALAVSELGTAMPKAGGGYYYVNRGLGPLFGSITGLGDWMGLAFASAFYCIGFGGYLVVLLEDTMVAIPRLVFGEVTLPLGPIPLLDTYEFVLAITEIQIGAIIAGAVFVGVNYIGAKETGRVQSVIVLTLLGILTVFSLFGWFSFDWGTVMVDGELAPTELGYGAILPATGLVFVSFLGYAKIATVAEEMKNPGRNLPIAIIGSVGIVTVLYAIIVGIMVGVVPWWDLHEETPVSQVAEIAFDGWPLLGAVGVTLVTVAALLATASSANASILSSARINFAMGRDQIVTNWLNDIHPRYATPYRSILVTGVMIVGFIIVLGQDLAVLATAASVLHLIVYALMNLALIAFREGDVPEYDPDFSVPLYPITPIVGAVASLGLIYFIQWEAQVLALLFVVGAVGWYYVYARSETTRAGVIERYVLDRVDEMPEVAVSAAELTVPEAERPYRVVVPVANPATESNLIGIGSALAKANDGVVHAVHVVEVPPQTDLEAAREQRASIESDSEQLLEQAVTTAESFGAEIETHRIISHRSMGEVVDFAERMHADVVVMGWSPSGGLLFGAGSAVFEGVTGRLPCDLLIFRDRGFDTDRVLIPTAGGEDSDLSAEVAKAFHEVLDAEIGILTVVDEPDERAAGMGFIAEWAEHHGLPDAELLVEDSRDVEDAIVDVGSEYDLVVMGATGRGLLTRVVRGDVAEAVAERLSCSVMLAERRRPSSLRERLFGRQIDVDEIEADSSA